ncbi:MAG: alpha/beta hydrolase, partial [Akkermansiaceae bacterium]|nr:alpha/beta hydrolase [Akkermansiaceae bacterium]
MNKASTFRPPRLAGLHLISLLSIGMLTPLGASQIDTLVENVSDMGDGGLEEARKSARAHAASDGGQLGYHSTRVEERRFSGNFTLPELPAGQKEDQVYGMAMFSDDGCDLIIDGEVVHSRFRMGQGLPKLKQSFHELDVEFAPGQEIYVELQYSNTYYITQGGFADIDGATIYIYKKKAELRLAVDADRDGDIHFSRDRTSTARPYRFWINNDHDRSEDQEKPKGWRWWWDLDHVDEKIRTQRDLEDFTRLQMVVGDYHEELKKGKVQAVLRFDRENLKGNPAIRVWPHLDAGGSRAYLVDENAAEAHTDLKPLGVVTAGGELVIPRKYWQGKRPFRDISPIGKGKSRRHFLYEGMSKGQGALVLELRKDGKVLSSSKPCWLRLMDVREMYQRAKVTPDDPKEILEPTSKHGEEGNPLVKVPEPDMGWTWDPWGKDFVRDPAETKNYLIFVHGWRMTYPGSQKYAENMFKRCWQAGYRGRFLFIRWPTYSEETNEFTNGYLTYNVTDYRAWKSGKSVAAIVNSLPSSYTKNICAHSMGNIVVGSAFHYGLKVNNYALFNAAVPAMCYDDDKKLHEVKGPFPDDDQDPITKSLGYDLKFNVPGNTVFTNFYLPNDKALANWVYNNRLFKPNKYLLEINPVGFKFGVQGYYYTPDEAPGAKLQFKGLGDPDRYLRSFHEAAAYAVRSKTKAV